MLYSYKIICCNGLRLRKHSSFSCFDGEWGLGVSSNGTGVFSHGKVSSPRESDTMFPAGSSINSASSTEYLSATAPFALEGPEKQNRNAPARFGGHKTDSLTKIKILVGHQYLLVVF